MEEETGKPYFKYWGKARIRDDGSGYDYHLLPYHCLDVAAVGRIEGNKLCRRHIVH